MFVIYLTATVRAEQQYNTVCSTADKGEQSTLSKRMTVNEQNNPVGQPLKTGCLCGTEGKKALLIQKMNMRQNVKAVQSPCLREENEVNEIWGHALITSIMWHFRKEQEYDLVR